MSKVAENMEVEQGSVLPEKITKKIKNAWMAGLVSISITVIFTLLSMTGADMLALDAAAFIDVFLMAIFVFGIYKNSRVCAVIMLILFATNKVIIWIEVGVGAASGLPLALIFLWFYTLGVIGTFQYHSFMKSENNA